VIDEANGYLVRRIRIDNEHGGLCEAANTTQLAKHGVTLQGSVRSAVPVLPFSSSLSRMLAAKARQ